MYLIFFLNPISFLFEKLRNVKLVIDFEYKLIFNFFNKKIMICKSQ